MKLYIASLADYNDGRLYGQWFDLDAYDDVDELRDAVEAMLSGSPYLASLGLSAEEIAKHGASNWTEYAVHDMEDCPDFLRSEYTPLSQFFEFRDLVDDCGEDEEAVEAYIDLVGDLDNATARDFADKFVGKYDSEEDFVMSLADDGVIEIPSHLYGYIDWEALARDYFINDYTMISGYVFYAH